MEIKPPTLSLLVPPSYTGPAVKWPHTCFAVTFSVCCLQKLSDRAAASTELLLLLRQVTDGLNCQKVSVVRWVTDAALLPHSPEWPAVAETLIGHLDDRRDPSEMHPSCPPGAAETRRLCQDTGRVFVFILWCRSDDIVFYTKIFTSAFTAVVDHDMQEMGKHLLTE